jgi:hypothetical protein
MAALSTQFVVPAGTAPTFGAASVSDTAEVGNGKSTFAVFKNTGTQKTITIVAPGTNTYQSANPDPAITLPATTGEVWIPLRKEYVDTAVAGAGRCTITLDVATAVTVAIVQMG